MWLITTIGFFSVVQKPGDTDLTVRARVAEDLERLRELYMPELGLTDATPKADYGFRAKVTHEAFGRGMAKLAMDIDYDNFKNEVYRRMGSGRAHVYSEVHGTLVKLQKP